MAAGSAALSPGSHTVQLHAFATGSFTNSEQVADFPLVKTRPQQGLPMTKDFPPDMRSKQLNLNAYDTDKIKLSYLDVYDQILVPCIDKAITLLEIGVYRGGSLKLWRDYFPRGTVVGIDRKLPQDFQLGDRIKELVDEQGAASTRIYL